MLILANLIQLTISNHNLLDYFLCVVTVRIMGRYLFYLSSVLMWISCHKKIIARGTNEKKNKFR